MKRRRMVEVWRQGDGVNLSHLPASDPFQESGMRRRNMATGLTRARTRTHSQSQPLSDPKQFFLSIWVNEQHSSALCRQAFTVIKVNTLEVAAESISLMIPDSLMITEGSGLITALEDQQDLLTRRTQGMEARIPDVLYGPQQCEETKLLSPDTCSTGKSVGSFEEDESRNGSSGSSRKQGKTKRSLTVLVPIQSSSSIIINSKLLNKLLLIVFSAASALEVAAESISLIIPDSLMITEGSGLITESRMITEGSGLITGEETKLLSPDTCSTGGSAGSSEEEDSRNGSSDS
ncbi:hypothetical protein DNTS_001724 [Danionella cerebrum]|uniref:Uncharacterized protein n=1 Tax=Danionella cerebrum TaxID=2873325 RepID=A0A553QV07_9TELE|nr:hypothetical protein DNTS_001724 [Danionella translucida]